MDDKKTVVEGNEQHTTMWAKEMTNLMDDKAKQSSALDKLKKCYCKLKSISKCEFDGIVIVEGLREKKIIDLSDRPESQTWRNKKWLAISKEEYYEIEEAISDFRELIRKSWEIKGNPIFFLEDKTSSGKEDFFAKIIKQELGLKKKNE